MRFIPLALVLAAASDAAAQPVTQPTACAVTIARAPDDVRQVVEAWVAAEPRCSTALELRIVVTDGGYYLLARDEHGRIRDRVVPDAQSAGVLVASWVADDALPLAPIAPPLPVHIPARDRVAQEQLLPPGSAAAIAPGAPTPGGVSKWLSAGGLLGMRDGGGSGIRAELDVKTWTRWSFGIAGSYSDSVMGLYEGYMQTTDAKAVAYFSRTSQMGRWHLRASVGGGLVHTEADMVMFNGISGYTDDNATGYFPTAEASLVIARELGKSWALAAGPLVSIYGQTFTMVTNDANFGPMYQTVERRGLDLMLHLGLRHRL